MPIVAPPPVTLAPGTHRFFDDLVTALAATTTSTAGYITHAGETAYRFLDDTAMHSVCLTRREARSTLEVVLQPASILEPLTRASWPASLDIRFVVVTEASDPPPSRPAYQAALIGMQRLGAHIIEHAFVAYYESVVDLVHARHDKVQNWPPTLQFARTIRNTFAHGGKINITDARPTGTWGGLTYSAADNGRQVMYNDMALGDVVLLMTETDQLF